MPRANLPNCANSARKRRKSSNRETRPRDNAERYAGRELIARVSRGMSGFSARLPAPPRFASRDSPPPINRLREHVSCILLSVVAFCWKDVWHEHNTQKLVAGDSTVALVSSLKPATTYHFRVLAENHLGTSAPSDILHVSIKHIPHCRRKERKNKKKETERTKKVKESMIDNENKSDTTHAYHVPYHVRSRETDRL